MFLLLWKLSLVSMAFGWGGDGHRLITTLARNLMTSRNVESLLGSLGDLMKASTWADSDEAEEMYPVSGAYHFSNTPYRNCQAFDMNRDCGFGKTKGLCIVTGLSEAITRAVDPDTPQSVRTDALKFIIHLMADIHQPLHTGFREDTGGLRIILGNPDGFDLHAIWDTQIINELRSSTGDLVADLQKRLNAKNGAFIEKLRGKTNLTEVLSSEGFLLDYLASIASETATTATCSSAYTNLENQWIGVGESLTPEYYSSRIPIVIVQILKASVRLGSLIDSIADTLYARRTIGKEKRKTVRIAKLFERKPDDAIDVLSDNKFAPLFIDFNPEVAEYVPAEQLPVGRSRARRGGATQGSKVKSKSDDALLDEACEQVTIERASYTFFGIDLTEIVFIRQKGKDVITLKSRIENVMREEYFSFQYPVSFTDKHGKVKDQIFHFDHILFPDVVQCDLIIRSILKVSGIDPRIDISEYRESMQIRAPIEKESTEVSRKLIDMHSSDMQLATLINKTDSVVERITGFKRGEIRRFELYEDEIFIYVHQQTLLERTEPFFHTRFYRYWVRPPFKSDREYLFLVDPAILDVPVYTNNENKNNIVVLHRASVLNPVAGSEEFLDEIVEAATFHKRWVKGERVPYQVSGKHLEWLFDYPGYLTNLYYMLEWFRKGVTENEIKEYLGLEVRTHRVYSDDLHIVPYGFADKYVEWSQNQMEEIHSNDSRRGIDDPVATVLWRIDYRKPNIMGFQVGNLKAYFHAADFLVDPLFGTANKFVRKTIRDDGSVVDSTIYLIGIDLMINLIVPLADIDPIITELDKICNWSDHHPHRPSLMAELSAIEYLMTSNDTAETKLKSPLLEAINNITEVKPVAADYGRIEWMGNKSFR